MLNLYLLVENFSNGLNALFLHFISLTSVLCGIFVIISKNPIVSVLFLIGLFLSISGYLMMLGINFIGLSYLLVYVGAVSILFLFILMLINVRISEFVTDTNNSAPLAVLIGLLFYYIVYNVLPYSGPVPTGITTNANTNIYDLQDSYYISHSLNKVLNLSEQGNYLDKVASVSSKI